MSFSGPAAGLVALLGVVGGLHAAEAACTARTAQSHGFMVHAGAESIAFARFFPALRAEIRSFSRIFLFADHENVNMVC